MHPVAGRSVSFAAHPPDLERDFPPSQNSLRSHVDAPAKAETEIVIEEENCA
jgi:hypothetical protein